MGMRFQKAIRLWPGLRLNASKSGVSISASAGGFTVNKNKKGYQGTVALHGTGLSYSAKASKKKSVESTEREQAKKKGLLANDAATSSPSELIARSSKVLSSVQASIASAEVKFNLDLQSAISSVKINGNSTSLSFSKSARAKFHRVHQSSRDTVAAALEELMDLRTSIAKMKVGMFDRQAKQAKYQLLSDLNDCIKAAERMIVWIEERRVGVDEHFERETGPLRQ